MRFFADTASLEEIQECFSRDVDDGITTNPKILETTGDLSMGFEVACRNILKRYPETPVSLETDLRGIPVKEIDSREKDVAEVLLQQAHILASWGDNVVIKIPICKGGLIATRKLSSERIKTNVTACMTPYQAIKAAEAGGTYVSLFANRMLDSYIFELSNHCLKEITGDSNWKEVIKENKERYFEEAWNRTIRDIAYVAKKLDNTESSLIVGSIRSPDDIYRIVKAEPQVITIPYKIVQGLGNIIELKRTKRSIEPKESDAGIGRSLYHPMTQYTLNEFEKSADSYRTK